MVREHDERREEDRKAAAYFARMLDSEDVSEEVNKRLGEFLDELFNEADIHSSSPELLPVTYGMALARLRNRRE